jgi:hypothetical protein
MVVSPPQLVASEMLQNMLETEGPSLMGRLLGKNMFFADSTPIAVFPCVIFAGHSVVIVKVMLPKALR